jgi:putative phosphonate metabolism protein
MPGALRPASRRSSNGPDRLRYAIYFLPDPATTIAALAARWFGRDMETGAVYRPPITHGLDASEQERLVATPRRYGFHATLKAPFHLAPGRSRDELLGAFRQFARAASPVRIPVVSLTRMRRFFAFVPAVNDEELAMLGSDAIHFFERFRAPLSAQEEARRRASGLSRSQNRHLEHYGYPYVLDEFRFHLTLTGPIEEHRAKGVWAALEAFFQPVLGRDLAVDRVGLVVEPAPGSALQVLAVAPLGDPLAFTRRAVHVEAHYGEIGFVRALATPHSRRTR